MWISYVTEWSEDMWTLGFDTVSSVVSAAILRDSEVVCSYTASAATTHSTTLLPAIEYLLSSLSLKVSELNLICFSAGPGSFTGVRIGCATAKGLAAPFDIPCIGVSSLRAMAEPFARIKCAVCPALNARRGNVYAAVFVSDGEGNITALTEDDLVPVAELPNIVFETLRQKSLDELTVYAPGDFAGEIVALSHDFGKQIISLAPHGICAPSGIGAALAGLREYNTHSASFATFDESLQKPIYLRKPQAEREKEAKLKTAAESAE